MASLVIGGVKEDAVVPGIDDWLGRLFDNEHLDPVVGHQGRVGALRWLQTDSLDSCTVSGNPFPTPARRA